MLEKIILAPYYLVLHARHALYNHGVIKTYTAEVPTICVGNITAGGTGKTPHTEMILRTLLESHEWGGSNIAVLSRGHKRSSRGFQQVTLDGNCSLYGDEPLQIKKKFPTITVAVDRPRVEGCDFLCHPEKLHTTKRGQKCKEKDIVKSDIIVLDDAFQYRKLKADFNIVLVDYNRPVNKDKLLPFGRLRDLPQRLYQADVIIVTKCPAYMEDYEKANWAVNLGIKDYDPETCQGTGKKGNKVTVLFTFINYCDLKPVFPEKGDTRYIYSQKLILFTGIAKDTPLRRFLSDSYKIVKHFSFSDHHKYSSLDFSRIMSAVKAFPTAVVATTEKDSQRILDYKNVPDTLQERLFQVPIQVYFLSDHEKEVFEKTMLDSLRKKVMESEGAMAREARPIPEDSPFRI